MFDSWENLRPAADNEILVKMLSEFSNKVVADRVQGVFRVTIGKGGNTPAKLTHKETTRAELMLNGYQYGDSGIQAELASVKRDDTAWLKSIDEALSSQSLKEEEKAALKEYAPMTAQYAEMLKIYLSNPLFHGWISTAVTQNNKVLDLLYNLTGLYSLVQDNTANLIEIMFLLINGRDDLPIQVTMNKTPDVALSEKFVLLASLILKLTNVNLNARVTPALLDPLKEALCNLSSEERAALLACKGYSKYLGIAHTIYAYPNLLKAVLMLYPESERLLAVREQDMGGRTVLHCAAQNPESLKTILTLYLESERLLAIREKDNDGRTVLHCAAKNPESLNTILSFYPADERLLAVMEKNRYGRAALYHAGLNPESLNIILALYPEEGRLLAVKESGVLHYAASNPESIKTILMHLPKTARLLAVKEKGDDGEKVLHRAAEFRTSFKSILEVLPESDRLLAVKEKNRQGQTVLHQVVIDPNKIRSIFDLLPEADRLLAIKEKDDAGRAFFEYSAHFAFRDSFDVILKFLPNSKAMFDFAFRYSLPLPRKVFVIAQAFKQFFGGNWQKNRVDEKPIASSPVDTKPHTTSKFRDEVSQLKGTDEGASPEKRPKGL